MTLNMNLARDGKALEKHDTTILRAPTDSSRKSQLTAVFVGGDFPTAAPGAAEEDDDEEEDDEDEDDEEDDDEDEDEDDEDEEDGDGDEEDAPVKG